MTASEFGKHGVYIPRRRDCKGPAQDTILGIQMISKGGPGGSYLLYHYTSQLHVRFNHSMFLFILLYIKCLRDVYTHDFSLRFTVLYLYSLLFYCQRLMSDYIAV